jgi:hypothetical protein
MLCRSCFIPSSHASPFRLCWSTACPQNAAAECSLHTNAAGTTNEPTRYTPTHPPPLLQAHNFGTLVYLNSSTAGGLGTPGAACPLPSTRPYCGQAPLKSLKLIGTEAGTTRATGQHIGDAYIFCDSTSCYFTSIGVYDDTLRCQWYLDDVPATGPGAPGYSCLSYAVPRASLNNGTHYFVGTFGYVPRGATCRCSSCQVGGAGYMV